MCEPESCSCRTRVGRRIPALETSSILHLSGLTECNAVLSEKVVTLCNQFLCWICWYCCCSLVMVSRCVSCFLSRLAIMSSIRFLHTQTIKPEHSYSCIPAYDILRTGWWCYFVIYFPNFF